MSGDAAASGGTAAPAGAGGAGTGGAGGAAGAAGVGGASGAGSGGLAGTAGAGGGSSGAAGAGGGSSGAAGLGAGGAGGAPVDGGPGGAGGSDGGCVPTDATVPLQCSTHLAGATASYDPGTGLVSISLPGTLPRVARVSGNLDLTASNSNFYCTSFSTDVQPPARDFTVDANVAVPLRDLWIRNLTVEDECGTIHRLDPTSSCVEPHLLFDADAGTQTLECGNQPDPDCSWDCS